jgi:ribosomal protein S27E
MPAKKKKAKAKKEEEPTEESEGPKAEIRRRKDCPDCGSDNISFDPETEQLICQDCGLIFEELPGENQKKYDEVDLL